MKARQLGLLLLLALAGCKQQQVKETQHITIDQTFARLDILSQVGDITIQKGAGTATDVGLTAEKFAKGCAKDQAQQYLDQIEVTYKVDNNTCTITVLLPENKPQTVYGGANLTITGVQDMPLNIVLNVGSIECATMNGGSISNNVGNITVAAATGTIELTTNTGDIAVSDYSGSRCSLRADVGTTDIHIADNGTLDGSITTGAGDISCEIPKNRSADVALQTGVGDISIIGITDFTKTGFISLQASFELGTAEGNFNMETGTGAIAVKVF